MHSYGLSNGFVAPSYVDFFLSALPSFLVRLRRFWNCIGRKSIKAVIVIGRMSSDPDMNLPVLHVRFFGKEHFVCMRRKRVFLKKVLQ